MGKTELTDEVQQLLRRNVKTLKQEGSDKFNFGVHQLSELRVR